MRADWLDVIAELDHWGDAGQLARLWLRDDDAVSATPALDDMLSLIERHGAPVLFGVIPMLADESLVQRLARSARASVAMHGITHVNRAAAGQKKQELPPEIDRGTLIAELERGRERLLRLFGPSAGGWYIPPWNRISPQVARALPLAGFVALSCFGATDHGVDGLIQRNTHVDLIDWGAGRSGKPARRVAAELVAALVWARIEGYRPVGVLTHHLDHDASATASLSGLLETIDAHPAARWIAADELFG
jgi:peptidoglycan/xylan/chitin deacetylase (PgdA/CDA1 family)